MNIRADKVNRFLSFFLHHNDGYLPHTLNVPNKLGDAEGFGFSIDENGDLSKGGNEI